MTFQIIFEQTCENTRARKASNKDKVDSLFKRANILSKRLASGGRGEGGKLAQFFARYVPRQNEKYSHNPGNFFIEKTYKMT